MKGVAETVDVVGSTPVIETGRSQVSSTVTELAVQNLPVNGRNFIDFALLTPGVTRDVRTGDISFRRSTRHVEQPGRRRRRQQQHLLRPDDRPHRIGTRAVPVQPGCGEGVPGQLELVLRQNTGAPAARSSTWSPSRAPTRCSGSVFEFYRDKALNANNAINELNNRPKSPVPLPSVRRDARRADPAEPRLLFRELRRPAQHAAQSCLPESARVDAVRSSDARGDRATAAAGRQLEPEARSGRVPDQDRSPVERAAIACRFRYNHQNFTGEGFENGGAQNAFEHTGASLVRTRSFNAVLDLGARHERCSTSRKSSSRATTSRAWRTATIPKASCSRVA